jgi:rRNA maturation endonuclease Nob1
LNDPDLSARAEQAMADAAALPTTEQVRELAQAAEARGATARMSEEDIREVARQAIEASERMTVMLRRLENLLVRPAPGSSGGGR